MMRKILRRFVPAIAALLMLHSCDDPTYPDPDGEKGVLSLSELEITVDDATTQVAGTSRVVDTQSFLVNVKKRATGEVVATWRYDTIPSETRLLTGNYTLEAYNAEVSPADWETPYYYSSANVEINADSTTAVGSVACSLSNIGVSVEFSDALKTVMEDAVVEVTMAQGATLEYGIDETREGYFMAAQPTGNTLVAQLTGTVNGAPVPSRQVLASIAAGEHVRLTFDTELTPTISSETFDLNGTNNLADYTVGNKPASLNVSAPNGVASLKVTINSEYLSLLLPLFGMTTEFDLATGLDSNGTDITNSLVQFGFPVAYGGTVNLTGTPVQYAPVMGETSVDINLGTVLSMLSSASGQHEFVIEVTDAAGIGTTAVLKLLKEE